MKRFVFLLLTVMLASGCEDPTHGIVSGTISVDGVPAETGSIGFIPMDGKSTTAGAPIEEGVYTAIVPVGMVRVEIRVPKIVGKKRIYNTKDSPIQDVMVESLPVKYNDESELTFEVAPGKSQQDYDLSGKKSRK